MSISAQERLADRKSGTRSNARALIFDFFRIMLIVIPIFVVISTYKLFVTLTYLGKNVKDKMDEMLIYKKLPSVV